MSKEQHNDKTIVNSNVYNDKWIESAWGSGEKSAFYSKGKFNPRPRVKRSLELCDLCSGKTLLDIACGRGEIPLICASMGVISTGIDFSESVLQQATKFRENYEIDLGSPLINLSFIRADATQLPFDSGSFDRITMLDIVEHLNNDQLRNMFSEVFRLLKPDGYAVIHTLPNRWVYEIGYKLARKIIKNLPENPRSEIERKIHINEQSIIQLKHLMTDIGFRTNIWLEQLIPAQARFESASIKYSDNRNLVYPKLSGLNGRVLEALSLSPAKLVLSNDIFCLAWKGKHKPKVKTPIAITEKVILSFFT